eukprot:TRINITY_DN36241_c0_g1_i1.p1 TRINITY_DN36241_c0_g1~~TRINITY_DN36241_c0_g1_i1.p1  ORF type:complete len:110 (+),score=13.43 TRINITY_DN36241_c0_g1_i1:136-465(+)
MKGSFTHAVVRSGTASLLVDASGPNHYNMCSRMIMRYEILIKNGKDTASVTFILLGKVLSSTLMHRTFAKNSLISSISLVTISLRGISSSLLSSSSSLSHPPFLLLPGP